MKTFAFAAALLILAVGAAGIVVPSGLAWIARHSATTDALYIIGAVRVALGFMLIAVAKTSRAPRALRALGYIILIVGVATALTGMVAIEGGTALIDWWLQQGPGVARLTSALVMVLGCFVAYACAPTRRPA